MVFQSSPYSHHPSTHPQVFQVDRREISYLRFTLESYDGMAAVTTLDPYIALIRVSIAPGCEDIVLELLDFLKNQEGLRIEKVANADNNFRQFKR